MARSMIKGHVAISISYPGFIAAALAAIFTLIIAAAPAASAAVGGATASLSEDDEVCLSCHGSEGMEKDLADGDILPLHIRGAALAASIHDWVGCAGCHANVDLEDHPGDRTIESRHAYATEASQVCSECHADEDLADGPAHHARVSVTDGPACAECHDPHAVTPISEWKADVGESTYCVTCHGQALSVRLENGESFALSIDEAVLRDSVHLDHDCADCHTGYSKEAHEMRTFASTREHTIAQAEVCRDCHEDKFQQYEGSIHAALIDGGNLAAPVCSDCHGSHSVRPKAVYETIAGVPCKTCHADIFDAYLGSTHGQARSVSGHFEAPICADCHRAHEIGAAAAGNRLRDACIGCHADAPDAHQDWLPNAALHLEAVSCPACHAPMAQRQVELMLFDKVAQIPASEPGNAPEFEARVRVADAEGDGLDAFELWSLVRDINRGGETPEMTLHGRIAVRTGVGAHQLSDKTSALKDCSNCHQQGAEAFQNVSVSIVGGDGRPVRYDADKDVLNSVMSVDSVSGFYAIGGTRIKLLDVLLGFAFLGGLSVPVGHLSLKWLFGKFRKTAQGEDASPKS
jgi:hypothetical protein